MKFFCIKAKRVNNEIFCNPALYDLSKRKYFYSVRWFDPVESLILFEAASTSEMKNLYDLRDGEEANEEE